MMNANHWIRCSTDLGSASCTFQKEITPKTGLKNATLSVSSVGLFEARLNGCKLGTAVLTPGYTQYHHRTQYMTYDITALLGDKNTLAITVGPGWAVGRLAFKDGIHTYSDHCAATAELVLTYADGATETVVTDESWQVFTSHILHSDIYNGETVDLTAEIKPLGFAVKDETAAKEFPLVPQQGEDIVENERLAPVELIVTPKGERVIDFGQNLTGYVEIRIKAARGERILLSHGEVLDAEGNFYNANYRSATNRIEYVCDGGENLFKPTFSFQGFRYVRLDSYPDVEINFDDIRAIAVHSDLRRTGYIKCGNEKINQLYHNTIWGQKGNYLDIPTDCPQRDERLGWTGDAQVFCRTAALNFDVKKFFHKWLGELRLDQQPNGAIWGTCPENFSLTDYHTRVSAAWGDAATIIPWELYCIYGDKQILADNFEMMKKWVDYQHGFGPEEYLWLGGRHYGDWLAMDAGPDVYMGATSNDLIASAFFARSTELVIKAGEVLGEDVSAYRELYANILKAFRAYFLENGMTKEQYPCTCYTSSGNPHDPFRRGLTQTAMVLILHFNLCLPEERPAFEQKLVELIEAFDGRMTTGFVGTPYILHVLSRMGREDLAFNLLFEERNPSWLFSVNHGATTIWEHWNGIKEDGSFWSTDMNSFNHYAYGSVFDWVYGVVAGIRTSECAPGYRKFTLTPHPDKRLGFLNCALDTVSGRMESNWYYKGEDVYFEFTVPAGCEAALTLPDGYTATLTGGSYCFTVKG
ncbi:MAG: family 78 glycoside hydrolase catalytic domain [Clostridia bacterium]|nr:family 78 glycoside hydrolase catalytic domain [Clostridia bacterium]